MFENIYYVLKHFACSKIYVFDVIFFNNKHFENNKK